MKAFTSGLLLVTLAVPAFALEDDKITIIKTASTNSKGFAVAFDKDCLGLVTRRDGGGNTVDSSTLTQQIDADKCAPFIEDLDHVADLRTLGGGACARSISFGTEMFIERDGVRSLNIGCSNGSEVDKLHDEALQILGVIPALP